MARIVSGPQITGQVRNKQTGSSIGPVTVTVNQTVYTDAEFTTGTTTLTTDGMGRFSCYAEPGTYTFTSSEPLVGPIESVEVLSPDMGAHSGTGRFLTSTEASAAYAPVLSTLGLSAKWSLAEAAVSAGLAPPRMSPAPTVVGATKASGLTGTPTVSAGGSGYVVGDTITLAGGTALVPAVLTVATLSGSAVATVTVRVNGIYTATPANAVAQASTSGAGTGATFTAAWSAGGMSTSVNRQQIGPTDTRYRFTGVGPVTNEGGSGFYGGAYNTGHSTFEWSTDSQRVDIKLIGLNTSGVLYVDGKQVSAASITTDASASNYIYSLDFGSAVMRTFKWVAFNNGFGGVYVDGIATLTAPLATAPPLAWSIGDSYTGATGADNAGSQHAMVMADSLGLDLIPDGVSGAGWNSAAGNVPATRVTAHLGALTRVPSYVFYDMGFNDAGGNMTTAAAAFDAAHAAALAVAPAAKYFCFGPATPQGRTTNLDLVRDMLIARCAANGVTFIDVGDWVNATNKTIYTGGDNIHPTARGHKFLGTRRAESIRELL